MRENKKERDEQQCLSTMPNLSFFFFLFFSNGFQICAYTPGFINDNHVCKNVFVQSRFDRNPK